MRRTGKGRRNHRVRLCARAQANQLSPTPDGPRMARSSCASIQSPPIKPHEQRDPGCVRFGSGLMSIGVQNWL
ncbi:hypothetical protein SFHH103_psfHH103d_444 (plasmid) [Sinorhizobium fredii HH103]|nr:hypothetical protein SFHH103_psfHH103d_444 [Sinorhizobium fredii HH103]